MTSDNELLTGEGFLESVRDGRRVFVHGEPVDDVTRHPAFRNSALSIARLYDSLHDPGTHDLLTAVDDQGIRTHKFFKPSKSAGELAEAATAIEHWSRLSYGFMGRTPDYKASFMAGLSVTAPYYGTYADNARSWYERYARQGLFLNHALVNMPVGRDAAVHTMRDVFVHAVRETDAGIVVSGAKMLVTGAALTHAVLVAQKGGTRLDPEEAADFALVFFVRPGDPGVTLISRRPYAREDSTAYDQPLSSRFDENDAVLVLDEALIPWEDVLVYRDAERASAFFGQSGFVNRNNLQAGVRLAVKLEFVAGLLWRAALENGTAGSRPVQAAVGEVINIRNALRALTAALALDPVPARGGTVVPRLEYASAIRMYASQAWARVSELMETNLGGSPLVTPAGAGDLAPGPERDLIDRFYIGNDSGAEERIKVFKLLWDAFGSEFASRHSLYERNYSGSPEQVRVDGLVFARRAGALDEFTSLVDQCLEEYGVEGWRAAPWK